MGECVAIDLDKCVSIVPSVVNLRLVNDADTSIEFILTDGKQNPVDITSDDVKFTVRVTHGGTQKLQKTNAAGSHSDPTNGKTIFKVTHTDITDALTDLNTKWVYEVRRMIAGGDEAVHITGAFIVDLAVGG